MILRYKPSFVREFKKMSPEFREEAFDRIEQFKKIENHKKLRVHKFKGRLKEYYSFSVTYSQCIVFEYEA